MGNSVFLLAIFSLGCGPTAEEIEATIDARVEARLLEEKLIKSEEEKQAEMAVEEAKPAWEKSMDFLAELDALMAGYQPTLPDEVDNTDVLRCTTDYELDVDKELKLGARALVKQAQASAKAREKRLRDFEKSKWVQYRIDYGWESRNGVNPIKDCFFSILEPCWRGCAGPKTCDGWRECPYDGMQGCYQQYDNGNGSYADQYVPKVRYYAEEGAPSYRYGEEGTNRYSRTTTPDKPELMKRIEAADLAIPNRFTCKVENARLEKDHVMVQCKGNQPALTHLRLSGEPPRMIRRGDLVSVPIGTESVDPISMKAVQGASDSVEGTVTKDEVRIDRRDHRVWLIHADGAALSFDELGECPAREDILEAAKAKK